MRMQAASFWWIVQKDLRSEVRAWRVWPRVLAVGGSVVFLFAYQTAVPEDSTTSMLGPLCWIAIGLAALLTAGEALISEQEEGCWQALKLYPVSMTTVYFAKIVSGGVALGVLQVAISLLLVATAGLSFFSLFRLGLVMLLGNVGLSALGTIVGALAAGTRRCRGLPTLLLLPLWVPILLAASKATSLLLEDGNSESWERWAGFLAAGTAIYLACGVLLFEAAIEE